MSTVTTPLIVQDVKEALDLCLIPFEGLHGESGSNYVRVTILLPDTPLHRVARKVAGCFCGDFQLAGITAIHRGYRVHLKRVEVTPDPDDPQS